MKYSHQYVHLGLSLGLACPVECKYRYIQIHHLSCPVLPLWQEVMWMLTSFLDIFSYFFLLDQSIISVHFLVTRDTVISSFLKCSWQITVLLFIENPSRPSCLLICEHHLSFYFLSLRTAFGIWKKCKPDGVPFCKKAKLKHP